MVFLSQLSFAILSTSLFLTGGSAVPDSPGNPLQLAKRFPDDWDTFNEWQGNCEIYPYRCTEIYDDAVGNFDKKAGTANWAGEECIEYAATFSTEPIASGFAAAVYKGSLETKKDGEVTKTQDVVFKRAPGESSYEVLYGASLAKDLSNYNDNILAPIDYFMSDPDGRKAGNAVYPYVSGGSIESNWGSFTSQDSVNNAFKQMLAAMNTVASAGIIHRDIKPENFLLDGNTVKLIDFDTAIKADQSDFCFIGTDTYAAPELVKPVGPYTNKVDTFSLAMSFMVMSVEDLRVADTRFNFWREMIQPNGKLWPSFDDIKGILGKKNYKVFNENGKLLDVLAKALCEQNARYTPQDFKTAFEGAI